MLWIGWAWAQTDSRLPDGPGKALLERTCAGCHDLEGIARSRNTKAGWAKIVDDMVARGAEGSDQEIEQIIGYLNSNLGKVNINKAQAGELGAALGVSKANALAIVEYREKNGPFKEWQDLAKVPGLDMKQIADKKDRVEFGS